jgi:uncharacterized protein
LGKEEALNIAKKYLQKVNNHFTIRNALMFGSFAKGTSSDESDIDIALVLDNIPDVIETQIELMKLRRDIDLRIEPHPFRSEDFNINDPVVYEILNNGAVVSR